MKLIESRQEGKIPFLTIQFRRWWGGSFCVTFFPVQAYGGGRNWIRLTDEFPRPFADLKLWPVLDSILKNHQEAPSDP